MEYIYIPYKLINVEYYANIKRKEIWPCMTTYMDFEDIMLSKINQTGKNKYSYV